MVNAIGGSGSLLISLQSERMRARQSPEERFKQMDTDSSGSLSTAELETVLTDITSKTGATLNVDDSIATYDADNDALLSMAEMDNLMRDVMEQYGPPGSTATMEQAIGAYQESSESDPLATLLQQLGTREMKGPPPPPPSTEETFNELDTNKDGVVSQEELDVLTETMESMTGSTFDAEAAIKEYDASGDGSLDMDEMDSLMTELRDTLGPPPRTEAGASMQEIVASYLEGADVDTVNNLIEILSNYAATRTSGTSGSVNTSA